MMRRVALLNLLVFTASLAHGGACPPVNSFLKEENGHYVVRPPSGWTLFADRRINNTRDDLHFSIAAWGNHKTDADYVRCYYYPTNGWDQAVEIHTSRLVLERQIEWQDNTSDHYKLCTSYERHNVEQCQFSY